MQLKSTKGVGGEGELSAPSSQLAYLISHNTERQRKKDWREAESAGFSSATWAFNP